MRQAQSTRALRAPFFVSYRAEMAQLMLRENWRIELNVKKADFIIETSRYRCAQHNGELALMEVKRLDRPLDLCQPGEPLRRHYRR
jgi:hypothetical protein